MKQPHAYLTFWGTARLIWSFARRRAAGRKAHQAALLSRKAQNSGTTSSGNSLGCIGTLVMIIFACVLHGMFGHTVGKSVTTAMRLDAERNGKIVVSDWTYAALTDATLVGAEFDSPESVREIRLNDAALRAAQELSRRYRSDTGDYKDRFVWHFHTHGLAGFVVVGANSDINRWPPLAFAVIGCGILLWLGILVCQGEGVEFDVQRRRHPVWEWLLSHPVRPAAVLVAETLTPFMANPMYYAAPVFWIALLTPCIGAGKAVFAGTIVGLALAIAASGLNKSIEAAAMLRLGVRNRGALLGIMSWFGFAGMLLPLFLLDAEGMKTGSIRACAGVLGWLPEWPVRALLGGAEQSAILAAAAGIVLALGLLAFSVSIATFAMLRGLDSGTSSADVAPKRGAVGTMIERFDPVFWKELLWFRRDRGAVVQAILIPLTLAAFQAFNLRALTESALEYWQAFCGTVVICGTYFLMVLGPRSLASEGAALWIPLTWPRGLEELLRAKARLWAFVANCIVGILLAVAAWLFPRDLWKIALVAVGWLFFCRGMAMRSVTIVSPVSESGETRPAAPGSRYAAIVGATTFAAGIFGQNWHVAIMGVVFTLLVAAACWQNLRARLPYLFDPWSEKLPPAPSLVHAMIAIALLVEVVGIALALASGIGGSAALDWTIPLAYGCTGFVAWLLMRNFLSGRGVKDREIWSWLPTTAQNSPRLAAVGVVAGAVLGLLAIGYLAVLWKIPSVAELLRPVVADDAGGSVVGPIGTFILAVCLAPIAEEYFFRGLLYRALDREWGGMRALLGSAAYFAIYHPPVSWLPVFALGVLNAWMFRRTRLLFPCVCAHVAYNAVVVGLQ